MSTENDKKNEPEEKKPINANPEENLNNSKDIEKQFLEGEEHKEFPENQIEPNIEEQNNVKEEEKEEEKIEEKNNSQTKNFLEEKMAQMNINKNVLTKINKSMDKQVKNLEDDILNNKVLMTEIPKNLNKILSRSLQKIPNYHFSNFDVKNKFKTLKDLQQEKEQLNMKLQKLIINEQFLENEGHMQMNEGSEKNFSPVDLNLYESKKKSIQSKKTDILNKMEQINDDIKKIVSSGEETSRKERIKNYLETYERDKELIEQKAKKYFQETRERNQRIQNNLNRKLEKLKKDIDEKEKREELKKKEIFQKFKEHEKAIIQKRTKQNDEKVNMFKPFLKKVPKNNVRNYLFFKKDEEYLKEEQILIDKENLRRKEKMKIDFNEIKEFEKNAFNYKEKFEAENAERKKKLLLEWKERKGTLPTYVCRFQDDLRKENEKEENQKELNMELKLKKQTFAYNIKNNKQPEINEKLKKQRTDLIKSLENPKLAVKERLLFQRQKKAEELLSEKGKEFKKQNKTMKKLKLKKNESDSINIVNSSTNMNLNRNNSNKKIFSAVVYPLHPKPEKKIDYLEEFRNEKEKKNSSDKNENNEEQLNNNTIKWEKAMNNNKGNLIENINYVKEKAKILDDNVKKKEKVLKLNGGIEKNPEMGQKISDLLIDSIEAKLSILSKVNNEE